MIDTDAESCLLPDQQELARGWTFKRVESMPQAGACLSISLTESDIYFV